MRWYCPSTEWATKLKVSAVLPLENANPVNCDARFTPPGPVKALTEPLREKLDGLTAWLKLNVAELKVDVCVPAGEPDLTASPGPLVR